MERGDVSQDSAARSTAAALESPETGESGLHVVPAQPGPAGAWPQTAGGPAPGEPDRQGPASPRRLLFVAWRDLANRRAGGSEVLVDRLAAGMAERGDHVTLLCGGPSALRPYNVVRSGGTYTQFARAPLTYWRHLRDSDLVVEVCNGMPFLTPLWSGRPQICLVNHVHTDLWRMMFPRPVAAAGTFAESRVLPWAHRDNLFLTVSNSTADALREIGIADDRIRQICNGVMQPDPLTPRSPEPLFLALGRLTEYKRIDLLLKLWDRVRQVVGGKLVIAGDGPERARLEAMAVQDVVFAGRVSEEEKHRLLCSAWMLLHPALVEGWGIVIAEAAIRGTPAIGFDVAGLRDSVVNGQTGLLVKNEGQFASAWASLALDRERTESMGAVARERAERLHWSAAVEGFAQVADEALARAEHEARRPLSRRHLSQRPRPQEPQ
jgi:glycosyltransferase involved in cell wall biosynthesis